MVVMNATPGTIDLITLEVIQQFIIATVREMRATMIKTAHSSIIYEGLDFSCALLDADAEGAIRVVPDWVCEVLSDRTEHVDRGKKRRIYRREGVGHLWYLDPRDRTLEVNRLVEGRWLEVDIFEGDGAVRAEPFEAIELILGDLWRW